MGPWGEQWRSASPYAGFRQSSSDWINHSTSPSTTWIHIAYAGSSSTFSRSFCTWWPRFEEEAKWRSGHDLAASIEITRTHLTNLVIWMTRTILICNMTIHDVWAIVYQPTFRQNKIDIVVNDWLLKTLLMQLRIIKKQAVKNSPFNHQISPFYRQIDVGFV